MQKRKASDDLCVLVTFSSISTAAVLMSLGLSSLVKSTRITFEPKALPSPCLDSALALWCIFKLHLPRSLPLAGNTTWYVNG